MKLFETTLDNWNGVTFELIGHEWTVYGYTNGVPFQVRAASEALCFSIAYSRLRVFSPALAEEFHKTYRTARLTKIADNQCYKGD